MTWEGFLPQDPDLCPPSGLWVARPSPKALARCWGCSHSKASLGLKPRVEVPLPSQHRPPQRSGSRPRSGQPHISNSPPRLCEPIYFSSHRKKLIQSRQQEAHCEGQSPRACCRHPRERPLQLRAQPILAEPAQLGVKTGSQMRTMGSSKKLD